MRIISSFPPTNKYYFDVFIEISSCVSYESIYVSACDLHTIVYIYRLVRTDLNLTWFRILLTHSGFSPSKYYMRKTQEKIKPKFFSFSSLPHVLFHHLGENLAHREASKVPCTSHAKFCNRYTGLQGVDVISLRR